MVMHIMIHTDSINGETLPLYVDDLEFPENEYEEIFLTLIDSNETITLPKLNSSLNKSGVAVFKNVLPNYYYRVNGFAKHSGQWLPIERTAFIVPSADSTKPTTRYPSGGIMTTSGDAT